MHAERRAREREFEEKVAVGDGVHAVARKDGISRFGVGKAEKLGGFKPVDGKRRSRNRPAAERAHVGGVECELKTLDVAGEHFDPRQYVVRRAHGLGALQVSVAGNENRPVCVGKIDKHAQKLFELCDNLSAGVFEKEAHVGGNLVVAAAGCVELCGGGNFLCERLLDVHVDVFERRTPLEVSLFDSL